jgi:hypothetical protein
MIRSGLFDIGNLFSMLLLLHASAVAQPPELVAFDFRHLNNDRWQGSCIIRTPIFQTAVFTITRAKQITSGSWQKGIIPTFIWAGVEVDSGYVDSAISNGGVSSKVKIKVANSYVDSTIEIEIYSGGNGVLRSQDGWFAIKEFTRLQNEMKFQVDIAREVPPNEQDRDIIRRALAILSSESVWNRNDDRTCVPTATQWSIYCAMVKATIDVTGAFHHRRPALQLVRQIVEERTINKKYKHRLMDYNNDSSTRFDNVIALFEEALTRIH